MPSYATCKDIRDRHGLIVWALYLLTDKASKASVSHRLRDLPHRSTRFAFALDPATSKPTPSWQDAATLAPMLLLTPAAVLLAWSPCTLLKWAGSLLGLYALIDTLNYYLRVLWFDDLTPGIEDTRRGVWSHRRILFLAVLGYLQSILLFCAFYPRVGELSEASFPSIFERSLLTATLTEVTRPVDVVAAFQVFTSLFFLVIAIGVLAAIAYDRIEFSQQSKQQ